MSRAAVRALAACLLLGGSPAAVIAQSATPAEAAAQVLVSEGDTMLVRGNAFSAPVRADVPLRSGDRIRTGADGRVQLRFTDGALISIQPGSDFRVESYALDANRGRAVLELVQGALRAVTGTIGKQEHGAWRLKTPTATIGIRGTEFTVAEAACAAGRCPEGVEPGLLVAVFEGRVSVSNSAGTLDVPAGSTVRVRDAATLPTLAPPAAPRARPRGVGVRGSSDGPGATSGSASMEAPESR
jgi:hypothetical protein